MQNIDNQATSSDRKERKTSQDAEVEQLDFRHVLTRHVQTKQKPCFLSELKTLNVREGEQAVFECRVEGVPEPNIAWAVNGKPIKESKYFQMSYDGKIDTYHLFTHDTTNRHIHTNLQSKTHQIIKETLFKVTYSSSLPLLKQRSTARICQFMPGM